MISAKNLFSIKIISAFSNLLKEAIFLTVFSNPSSKQNKLINILKKVNGSGIVYCKSRKRTREIEELLNLNGINAGHYHAGLSNDERNAKQEDWINNKIRIIACTNAFGMGIDKADVRTVIHYDVPDALENYYQEAGRAGRDGKKAYAVLFFNEQNLLILKSNPKFDFLICKRLKIFIAHWLIIFNWLREVEKEFHLILILMIL